MTDANDMISRKDAIEAVREYITAWDDRTINGSSLALVIDAIRALPSAGVAEPGRIECIVWGAMVWAANARAGRPGDPIPDYTGQGNIDAEVECRAATARILAALDAQPAPAPSPDVAGVWMGMEIAPKGAITESVGCRDVSEWFLGRVSPEFRDNRPPFIVIRRRAWPQDDSWECAGEAYYVPRFFDAWAEMPAALARKGGA